MRLACALLALLVLCPVCAWADEEPDIRFFYPIVTRRPVIERELEFGFQRGQSSDGNTNAVSAAIEWPLTRWWQLEIEVPFVIQNPRDAVSTAGPGDLTVENKFLLWRSIQHLAAVAGGFEVRLPSGSERRGLGGEFGVEPFLTAGIALGPFDVMARSPTSGTSTTSPASASRSSRPTWASDGPCHAGSRRSSSSIA